MNKKDNLNKALFDMFGVGSDPASKAAPEADIDDFDMFSLDSELDSIVSDDIVPEVPASFSAPETVESIEIPEPPVSVQVPPVVAAPVVSKPAPARGAITYLAPGTVMEGRLSSKGDVEIDGDFRGDISAGGNVTLRSNITGNITAAQLDIFESTLIGDIQSSGTVSLDSKSSVNGNINAGELICSGQVKGDLNVSGNTTLLAGAVVEGGITTGTIIIERGAIASGQLKMGAGAEK